jgi:hypothetical protein
MFTSEGFAQGRILPADGIQLCTRHITHEMTGIAYAMLT